MRPFISVVMPTYNRKETLTEVLPTIIEQTYPKDRYEIILSDSGSTDGTEEWASSLNVDILKFIVGENRGRSGARNRGIMEAKGDVVLFTDADILAEPDLLEEHAKIHEAYENTAVIGCEVQVDSLAEYESVRTSPEKRRHMHKREQKELSWLFFLTGNASARRETLIEVGMFDENFTGYGHEDLELGYRLKKHGVPIRYNARARNYHWHPVPFEERLEKAKMAGVSTMRFYAKYKDPMIKLSMGVNPFTTTVQSLVGENGWFMRTCREKAKHSPAFRELAIQYYYLDGVKSARDIKYETGDK